MLSLTFLSGEYVMIGDDIKIQVEDWGGRIHLAIEAPREIPIMRQAVYEETYPERRGKPYQKTRAALAADAKRARRRVQYEEYIAAKKQPPAAAEE